MSVFNLGRNNRPRASRICSLNQAAQIIWRKSRIIIYDQTQGRLAFHKMAKANIDASGKTEISILPHVQKPLIRHPAKDSLKFTPRALIFDDDDACDV
ncbi:catabolite regulation protein CreA [Sinomonas atrocyanea]|nr:hypothetical protein [Sinomonas atrocyanea]MDR6620803.1 catabolite regulation protein CreA [Sinomonas atrocyanea]